VRNVFLIQDLIHGYWRYRDMVSWTSRTSAFSQIRISTEYFTRPAIASWCEVTRYAAGRKRCIKNSTASHSRKCLNSTRPHYGAIGDDLMSLCAVQHVFSLQPVPYSQLTPTNASGLTRPIRDRCLRWRSPIVARAKTRAIPLDRPQIGAL